jgi:cytochrome c oxidase subunit 3
MSRLATQFDTPEQQKLSASIGMWIFLATELLLFGGLFLGYTVYRYEYAEAFAAGSDHLSLLSGTAMTAILLFSSLTAALADHHVGEGDSRRATWLLAVTAVLGIVFVALKFHEYWEVYHEGLFPGEGFKRATFRDHALSGRATELFFCLYFLMTGLHAIHMLIGVALVGVMAVLTARGWYHADYDTPIEMTGLYWHFVDIVWVFLFPLLYLIGGSGG